MQIGNEKVDKLMKQAKELSTVELIEIIYQCRSVIKEREHYYRKNMLRCAELKQVEKKFGVRIFPRSTSSFGNDQKTFSVHEKNGARKYFGDVIAEGKFFTIEELETKIEKLLNDAASENKEREKK